MPEINRAFSLETIIGIRRSERDKAITKALECAQIAMDTGSEPHAREAMRQRGYIAFLTEGIERNERELNELRTGKPHR